MIIYVNCKKDVFIEETEIKAFTNGRNYPCQIDQWGGLQTVDNSGEAHWISGSFTVTVDNTKDVTVNCEWFNEYFDISTVRTWEEELDFRKEKGLRMNEGGSEIRKCNRCKNAVSKSKVEGYGYSCDSCDEDLYTFETHTINSANKTERE